MKYSASYLDFPAHFMLYRGKSITDSAWQEKGRNTTWFSVQLTDSNSRPPTRLFLVTPTVVGEKSEN